MHFSPFFVQTHKCGVQEASGAPAFYCYSYPLSTIYRTHLHLHCDGNPSQYQCINKASTASIEQSTSITFQQRKLLMALSSREHLTSPQLSPHRYHPYRNPMSCQLYSLFSYCLPFHSHLLSSDITLSAITFTFVRSVAPLNSL